MSRENLIQRFSDWNPFLVNETVVWLRNEVFKRGLKFKLDPNTLNEEYRKVLSIY